MGHKPRIGRSRKPATATILIEEENANGNAIAFVEIDGGVCMLYLTFSEETGQPMRSVWVRNVARAPKSLELARIRRGRAPRNPRAYCREPDGSPTPEASALRLEWLPEGNGVALYERSSLLAVLPPRSGIDHFDGYAAEAIGRGPLAWELRDDEPLRDRFRDATRFWIAWSDEGREWEALQQQLLGHVETAMGSHRRYYAIAAGEWPPRALIEIPRPEGTAMVTLGMCVRPQPNVELHSSTPAELRRVELGVLLPRSWSRDELDRMAAYLAALSGYPWASYSWLGPGHTVECSSWRSKSFTFAALTRRHPVCGELQLGDYFDDPVHVLWLIPLTAPERTEAVEKGTQPVLDALSTSRWRDA